MENKNDSIIGIRAMINKRCPGCGRWLIANHWYKKYVCSRCGYEEDFEQFINDTRFGRMF